MNTCDLQANSGRSIRQLRPALVCAVGMLLAFTFIGGCDSSSSSPSEPSGTSPSRVSAVFRYENDSCESNTWDYLTVSIRCQASCDLLGEVRTQRINNDRNASTSFGGLRLNSRWTGTLTRPDGSVFVQSDFIADSNPKVLSIRCT